MKVISPTTGYLAVNTVNTMLLLLPVFREFHLAGEFSLFSDKLLLVFSESIKRFVLLTTGQRDKLGNTHIQTNRFFRRVNRSGQFLLGLKADKPMALIYG